MINISKSGNAIKFAFTDSDHYLYGNGEIECPVNSLSLIADNSNMITFRKANSNDIFLSFDPANSNLSDKAGVINFYKTNMVGSTGGGGGSESGITSGDVQTMIDNSLEDYYTDDEVDAALSGKADTSAVTAVASDVSTLSGQVATKVNTTDFNAYSAATDARIAEDEEVTAAALNDLQENKADTSAVTAAIDAAISGKVDTSAVTAVNDALTAHTANTTVHVTSAEKTAWNAKQDALYIYTENTNLGTAELHSNDSSIIFSSGGASITANNPLGINTFNVAVTGVTINNENVATEPYVGAALSGKADTSAVTAVVNDVSTLSGAVDDAKAYYISFATLATQGISDDDWDGIVAAIDDHRPIYAGYPRTDGGILYYGVECMNKNVSNTQIVLTSSDNSSHYFYTFTKNGSNDYSFTSETRPYVTDAEKTAWNAKAEPYSAGTGIEISGNVISATGGGSVTVDPTLDTGSTNPVANSAITTAINAKQDRLHLYTENRNTGTAELHSNDSSIIFNAGGTSITTNNPFGINTFNVAGTGVTINNEVVLTEGDVTSAITSASTNDEVAGAKAVYDAIQAGGGGGATYSAGYGINIDTANTISFNMPITCTTNTNENITIGKGTNNGNWSLLVGNDMSITNSAAAIGLCVSDQSIGGSSISGNTRGVLIGCQNTIKGGNISVGGGVAIGDRNESTNGGIVIGTASKASGSSTVAIGLSANATGTTKMNLNNQIKVDTNNQVYIKDKTNTTDVCIQDAIAALGGLKLVKLTQAEYDALATKDPDTLYIITNVVS